MREPRITAAPDYTAAALTMMGVNLTWIFFALWAVWGLVPVLLVALGLNHLLSRWQERRRWRR
ncbi:MAG: histidinol phosphate aminotransferase [Arenibacterium sp.]